MHICYTILNKTVGPMFHELKSKIPEIFHTHKKLISLQFCALICLQSMLVSISPLSRLSIHLTGVTYQEADKKNMIITQVHLVLGTKCTDLSHNTMPHMSQVLRECAICMLTAGMSTRAVAR